MLFPTGMVCMKLLVDKHTVKPWLCLCYYLRAHRLARDITGLYYYHYTAVITQNILSSQQMSLSQHGLLNKFYADYWARSWKIICREKSFLVMAKETTFIQCTMPGLWDYGRLGWVMLCLPTYENMMGSRSINTSVGSDFMAAVIQMVPWLTIKCQDILTVNTIYVLII